MSTTSTVAASRADACIDRDAEVEIQLARSRSDLQQTFQLLHHSYVRAGLEKEKPCAARVTPYHLLPTTEVIVARQRGQVISTVSLIGDGFMGVPMQSMYPVEVNQLRQRGLRIAEVGCLADRRESPRRFMQLFVKKTRLLVQVARARGFDTLVAATHPRHARFYKRALGFEAFGELTDCPYVEGNPAVALVLEFDRHRGTELYDQYFGNPIPLAALAPYRWEAETRRHYKRVLQRDRQIMSAASNMQGGIASAVVAGLEPHATT